MRVFTDLHVHVGSADGGRPVKITASRAMTIDAILGSLPQKGIGAVGVVDAASPRVLADIRKLIESQQLSEVQGGGLLHKDGALLVLGSEVEVAGPMGGTAHVVVYFPTFDSISEWSRFLALEVSNPSLSTQRARCSLVDVIESARSMGGKAVIAHAFTPHKSVYGSCARRLTDILPDLSLIAGLELGLSADTYLADRIEELSQLGFLSNSDAHSTPKIAREHNEMELPDLSFDGIFMALSSDKGASIVANYGLQPNLGKYHRTFCEDCMAVASSKPPVRVCEACGSGRITMGVLDRIVEIEDHSVPVHPSHRPPYRHQVPLEFIPGIGPRAVARLIQAFGNEMAVLHDASQCDLEAVVGPKMAQTIVAAREGKSKISSGGGGVYGRILTD